jgi:hypothetical protein
MTQPAREPEMPDWEAARILREIADRPRDAFIWPLRHRWAWPGNVREALLRGADLLEPPA